MGRLMKAALALLAVMLGAFAALSAYAVIWDRRHPMTDFWSESFTICHTRWNATGNRNGAGKHDEDRT